MKLKITYEDGSTEATCLPKKSMVYAIQRKLIKYSRVFGNSRPPRIVSVEALTK